MYSGGPVCPSVHRLIMENAVRIFYQIYYWVGAVNVMARSEFVSDQYNVTCLYSKPKLNLTLFSHGSSKYEISHMVENMGLNIVHIVYWKCLTPNCFTKWQRERVWCLHCSTLTVIPNWIRTSLRISLKNMLNFKIKSKGKVRPVTGYEGSKGSWGLALDFL
jgi:hypothetical protein